MHCPYVSLQHGGWPNLKILAWGIWTWLNKLKTGKIPIIKYMVKVAFLKLYIIFVICWCFDPGTIGSTGPG